MKKFARLLIALSLFNLAWIGHVAHAAQNNPVLPTSSPYPGLTMLGNINSAFQAFLSSHSGATAPSYGIAGTFYANTTSGLIEFYSGSNWLNLGTFTTTNFVPLVNGAPLTCPTATGSANAYVVTYSPAITAMQTGSPYCFITNFAVTGSATVNFNTIGAKTLKKLGGTNLASGDLGSGVVVTGYYDGTNFQITSQISQATGGTVTSVACGTGLAGGTITSTGTCSLAPIATGSVLGNTTGSTAAPSAIAISTLAGIGKISVQTFCPSGCTTTCTTTCTYTPTSGMKYAIFYMTGGGGSGAACDNTTAAGSPGGSAGGFVTFLETAAQISSSQGITIGSGPSGASVGPNSGTNGGTTSLGSLASCTGGAGSTYTPASTTTGPGSGGSCTVSTGTGIYFVAGQQGGYGSNDASGFAHISGAGGSNPIGMGGGETSTQQSANAVAGLNATGFGAGGSSCSSTSNGSGQVGGNAKGGFVGVVEYQ